MGMGQGIHRTPVANSVGFLSAQGVQLRPPPTKHLGRLTSDYGAAVDGELRCLRSCTACDRAAFFSFRIRGWRRLNVLAFCDRLDDSKTGSAWVLEDEVEPLAQIENPPNLRQA